MEDKGLVMIAIVFALIGIVGAGIQYLEGITCNNCSFTGNTAFDEIKVNTISKNDTSNNNSIIFNASQLRVTEQNSEFYITSWSGRNYFELLGDGGEDNSVFFNSASIDGTKYNTFLSQVAYDSEAGFLRNNVVITSVDTNVSETNSLILSPYDTQILSLSGTGNAYVCTNATGFIYRSGVACV